MQLTFILLFSFFSSLCFSATRLQFFLLDRNAMAIITGADSSGNTDPDSTRLFDLMNVPEQNSALGPGKSIVSSGKEFNLICGKFKNQCQFVLNKTDRTEISSAQKKMRFTAVGDEAAELTSLFHLDKNQQIYFTTADQVLRVFGNGQTFTFEASLP